MSKCRPTEGLTIHYTLPHTAVITAAAALPTAGEAFLRLVTAAGGAQEAWIDECEITFSTDTGMQAMFWAREDTAWVLDDPIPGKIHRPDGTIEDPATVESGALTTGTNSTVGTIAVEARKEQRSIHSAVGYRLNKGFWVPANEQYLLMLAIATGSPTWRMNMTVIYPNG